MASHYIGPDEPQFDEPKRVSEYTPVQHTPVQRAPIQRVTVTDFNMSFWSMIEFMIKLTFAAIPAAVMIAFIWIVFGTFVLGWRGL